MEQIDFRKTIDSFREMGFNPLPNLVNIAIPDAKSVLWRGLNYFTGNAEWLPELRAWKVAYLLENHPLASQSLLPQDSFLLRCATNECRYRRCEGKTYHLHR